MTATVTTELPEEYATRWNALSEEKRISLLVELLDDFGDDIPPPPVPEGGPRREWDGVEVWDGKTTDSDLLPDLPTMPRETVAAIARGLLAEQAGEYRDGHVFLKEIRQRLLNGEFHPAQTK